MRDSNLRPPACKVRGRLPRFSPNSFLSLLLHGFVASAFARNAYGLARLTGEFFDGFLTVVAATAMLYGLRSLVASTIQSLRYQRLMASTCPRSLLPIPPLIHSVSVGIPSWTSRS